MRCRTFVQSFTPSPCGLLPSPLIMSLSRANLQTRWIRPRGTPMGLPQRAGSPAPSFPALPPGVAHAAGEYQRLREIEKGHLALMARHNLLADWTPEIRETVIEARKHIQEANVARDKLRALVREI